MRCPTVGGGKSSALYRQDLGNIKAAVLQWQQDLGRLVAVDRSQWAFHVRIYCPFHDQWEWHPNYEGVLMVLYFVSPIELFCREELTGTPSHFYEVSLDPFKGWILGYVEHGHQIDVTWKILSVT